MSASTFEDHETAPFEDHETGYNSPPAKKAKVRDELRFFAFNW